MNTFNHTPDSQFQIIGFQQFHNIRIILFIFLLLFYIVIFIGNFFIVCLVTNVKDLHTPMYFFLSNLSLSDVLLTSNIVPNTLQILWTENGKVTLSGCILQYYIFGSISATECLLLTVMSYDRYQAICNPLQYSSVMTFRCCRGLITFCWAAGFTPTSPVAIGLSKLQFCHLNTIDHFFCDLAPFLELACTDISTVKMVAFSFSFLFTFFPFIFIIVSYACIIHTILRIKSEKGRQKAFSTCTSHLAVVSLYYGTLFILYGVPSKNQSLSINKILSLFYIIVTPLLNPIIYSLKNREISKAFGRILRHAK